MPGLSRGLTFILKVGLFGCALDRGREFGESPIRGGTNGGYGLTILGIEPLGCHGELKHKALHA